MGKPVSGPAAAPTPDEFKVRPHVRQLLLRYERRPTVNPDSQRDLTAWAKLTLALDPLEAAVLFGIVSAVDGGPEFDVERDGPVALLLRDLLNHRPALERLAQVPAPQARLAGRKPNLVRADRNLSQFCG